MMATTFTGKAETPHMAIGYTGEELPSSSTLGIAKAGTLKAAMRVDPSELGDLKDLKIMGFNVGLASRINISEITFWAAESLEEAPIVETTLSERPSKGWNQIELSDFTDIPNRPLYIGYTITTTGASYPVAAAGIPAEDGLWIDSGEGWENLSDSIDGILAMSLVITAENLPRYNLTLLEADISEVMHSTIPSSIPIVVRNSGSMTVTGFSVTCSEKGDLSQTFDISAVIKPNERFRTILEVLPLNDESETPFEFTVSISSINEGEDTNPSDNSISALTRVSQFTFTKRMIVEEFTTMKCVNCPRAANLLHQALEKEEYKDRVFGVCHHAGYFTDYLTQPCDEELLVLYGGDTYAPAMCFDRLMQASGTIVTDVPLTLAGLTDKFDECLGGVAEVDLNITAEWNSESGMLDVNVEGGSSLPTPPENARRITVYVLENDINTPSQAGGDANYMQQHVIRAYNSTWGDEISWDDSAQFKYSVSLPLPADIVPENMEVVGLISNYDSSNPFDCAIANSSRAARINWNDWSALTMTPGESSVVSTRFYDLTGNPISSRTKGIVIKVSTHKDGTIDVSKMVNN